MADTFIYSNTNSISYSGVGQE